MISHLVTAAARYIILEYNLLLDSDACVNCNVTVHVPSFDALTRFTPLTATPAHDGPEAEIAELPVTVNNCEKSSRWTTRFLHYEYLATNPFDSSKRIFFCPDHRRCSTYLCQANHESGPP